MQGRLLPKCKGRYQAHPVGYWQDEFLIASAVGLDCIEFILDYNDAEQNPLLKDGGIDMILEVSNETGVGVKTICADYFMESPLHLADETLALRNLNVLRQLLTNSNKLGVTDIVLPCVDQSSLKSPGAVERFVNIVRSLLDALESKKINLSLETDLPPVLFIELLEQFDSKRITVNYDIGNSASLGYNPTEELDAYGDRITDIHIKDRILNGGPVLLGNGDADFSQFFGKLKEFDYKGPFIMQAYRDNEGAEVFKQQLSWIKPHLEAF